MRVIIGSLLFGSSLIFSAYGQSVISAHSGVVHYVEGDVYVQDKPVELKFGQFPDLKPDQVLRTAEGRAELLLTPGSFLRVAENSELRMISNKLSDTRIELLKGTILVESVDASKDSASAMAKGNLVTVLYKDTLTSFPKAGLYEFSSDPGSLKVYEGEALVQLASEQMLLKRGKRATLEGALAAQKFDPKEMDDLTRWSSRRAGYLAMANVSAAKSVSSGGYSSGAFGFDNGLGYGYGYGSGYGISSLGYGGWAYNPLFGMFTYIPSGGLAYSPFGYSYYSPYTVYQYYPAYYYGGGGSAGALASAHQGVRNFGRNTAVGPSEGGRSVGFASLGHTVAPGFAASRGSVAGRTGGFNAASSPLDSGFGGGGYSRGGGGGSVMSSGAGAANSVGASMGGAGGGHASGGGGGGGGSSAGSRR